MSFNDDFENIIFDTSRKCGYVFRKVLFNLSFAFLPLIGVVLLYKLFVSIGFGFSVFSFFLFLAPFFVYLFSNPNGYIRVALRSVDFHADDYFSLWYNSALVLELLAIIPFFYLFSQNIKIDIDFIFVVLYLYFTGVFIISLLNYKRHIVERLIPFSRRPQVSYFLELPSYELEREGERVALPIVLPFRVLFERISIPPNPYRELSREDLLNLFLLPIVFLSVFPFGYIFVVFGYILHVSLVLLFLLIGLFIWYFLKMFSLETIEQVESTGLVLSFLVSVTTFVIVYYLVGINYNMFRNVIGEKKLKGLAWLRFHVTLSGLIALLATLLVVELPGYLVLSVIKDRLVESKQADIARIEKELDDLVNFIESSVRSGNEALVNVYRERIRILMSRKASLEDEIRRIEESPSSPVPLLDKVLSGGVLGLAVVLFTGLV